MAIVHEPRLGFTEVVEAATVFSHNPLEGTRQIFASHGGFAKVNFLSRRGVLLSDPLLIGELFSNHEDKIDKAGFDSEIMRRLIGTNMLDIADGEEWKWRRQMALPAFHRKMLASYIPVISAQAGATLDSWETDYPKRAGNPVTPDLSADLTSLTLRIATEAFFGYQATPEEAVRLNRDLTTALDFYSYTLRMGGLPVHLLETPLFRTARQALTNLRATGGDILSRGYDDPNKNELFGLMVHEGLQRPAQANRDALINEALIFLLAGHETTSTALTWTFTNLSKPENAKYLELLRKESQEVLTGELPDLEKVRSLKWHKAVMEESMRLTPPVWIFTRKATEDIGFTTGEKIEKDSVIAVCSYLTHRHPDYWDEPDKFRPERFYDKRPAVRESFIPFGTGERSCIGQALAMVEGPLILATMLKDHDIHTDTQVKPAPLAVLRPDKPISATIRKI